MDDLLDNACLPHERIPTTIFKDFVYRRIAQKNVKEAIKFIHCCIQSGV